MTTTVLLVVTLGIAIAALIISMCRRGSIPRQRKQRIQKQVYHVPINVNTRKMDNWRQVGVLHNDKGRVLPLYGRQTYSGSNKWNYYTASDGNNSFKLPIAIDGKDCSESYGCKELYEDSSLPIEAYGQKFNVQLYDDDKPKYIPFIIRKFNCMTTFS